MKLYAVIEAEEIDDSGEYRTFIKLFMDEARLMVPAPPYAEFYTDSPEDFKIVLPKGKKSSWENVVYKKFTNEVTKFIFSNFKS